MSTPKSLLLAYLLKEIDSKATHLKEEIKSSQEARNNDTKSSAGDKFETGREMIQAEIRKMESSLASLELSRKALLQINPKSENTTVEHGSLVITNNGHFFISIGHGKVELNGNIYYAISLASPIGQQLKGKSCGNSISFQGKEIEITQVI